MRPPLPRPQGLSHLAQTMELIPLVFSAQHFENAFSALALAACNCGDRLRNIQPQERIHLMAGAIRFTAQLALGMTDSDPVRIREFDRLLTSKLATWDNEKRPLAAALYLCQSHDMACALEQLKTAACHYTSICLHLKDMSTPWRWHKAASALSQAAVAFTSQLSIEESEVCTEIRTLERCLISKLEARLGKFSSGPTAQALSGPDNRSPNTPTNS